MKMRQRMRFFFFISYTSDLLKIQFCWGSKFYPLCSWWWFEIHFTGQRNLMISLEYAVFSEVSLYQLTGWEGLVSIYKMYFGNFH